MRVTAIAIGAALASAALWYLALAVALDVAAWIAVPLAALGAAITAYAIGRDSGRL